VLHVGDLHERRNLSMVLDAVLRARTRIGGAAPSLVVAGVDRGVGEALDAQARAAGIGGAFVRLGQVSEPRLNELYRSALALVYPSRYEGFGLPVLEAMASGTPVIAARAASIPEVLGDAGTLLEPDDTEGWADAIVAVACDEGLRSRMRALGLTRAAEFTWARTARITAGVYRRLVDRGGRL
jgi:alpha-1,3-rhamnosyl/mannosyltransferase